MYLRRAFFSHDRGRAWAFLANEHRPTRTMLCLSSNLRSLSWTAFNLNQQQTSTLRINGDKIESFPRCSESNFSKLRANPRFAYFDRTRYLSILDSVQARAILFLRPRRFGKSLTLSMIEHFHGLQHRGYYDKLFKDLDIDLEVKSGKIAPGEYMILQFNFAEVCRTPDLNKAAEGLEANITLSLVEFYRTYNHELGYPLSQLVSEMINPGDPIYSFRNLVSIVNHTLREIKHGNDSKHPLFNIKGIYLLADEYDAFSNQYMDPHKPQAWVGSHASSLIRDFWAVAKGMINLPYGIQKFFITGISPLSLVDNTSGFNIAVNISFEEEFAGLCGLNRADISAALEKVCATESDVRRHLETLTMYANGYHFCRDQKTEPVFNTDTSLEYLQAVLSGKNFNIANPPNSEVSQQFLNMCASSPAAVTYIQQALTPQPDQKTPYHLVPYSDLVDRFSLGDLQSRALGDVEETAFCSLLLYFGAFTFDKENPAKFLTIPNHIVTKRFGSSILRGYNLLSSMQNAVRFLALHGNILAPLKGYQDLMVARDIKHNGYSMTEAQHRDSFHIAILENPGLNPQVEYQVTKPGGACGLVDLVITSANYCIVTEWKTLQIEFLDVGNLHTWGEKAEAVSKLGVDELLKLKFHRFDKFRKGTIRTWVTKEVKAQLKSYVLSTQVRELVGDRAFHAYLVLVIGSRKILVWEMDMKGNWVGQPVLAENLKMPLL